MNIMLYKDYSARIEYSDEDQCLIGRLAGIDDLIGFHADSVTELRKEFEEAVDDYLVAKDLFTGLLSGLTFIGLRYFHDTSNPYRRRRQHLRAEG